MKKILFSALSLAFVALACNNYEKKDMYGSWKNSSWEFTFNEDGSCTYGNHGATFPCTYHTTGNALEINGEGSFQLSNISIKSIKNDTFEMEMRMLGSPKIERLARVKK